jgi:hypothetical protein
MEQGPEPVLEPELGLELELAPGAELVLAPGAELVQLVLECTRPAAASLPMGSAASSMPADLGWWRYLQCTAGTHRMPNCRRRLALPQVQRRRAARVAEPTVVAIAAPRTIARGAIESPSQPRQASWLPRRTQGIGTCGYLGASPLVYGTPIRGRASHGDRRRNRGPQGRRPLPARHCRR